MNSRMTPYLAQFDCHHGEYSFTETVRFMTDRDPHAFMREFVAKWYGYPDEDGRYFVPGVASFNGGEIVIEQVFKIRAISPAMFDELDALDIVHLATLDPHPLADQDETGGAR